MARPAKKKTKTGSSGMSIFDDSDTPDLSDDEALPKDEAGRAKIKQQYIDLLAIRVRKLKGNILNRERINKTVEGIYFICIRCEKVCHNLDEGLVEDEKNINNMCKPCAESGPVATKHASSTDSRKSKTKAAKKPRKTKASRTAS